MLISCRFRQRIRSQHIKELKKVNKTAPSGDTEVYYCWHLSSAFRCNPSVSYLPANLKACNHILSLSLRLEIFDVPEKFDAPEIVLIRGWRFGGIFHVVGSSTDMLSSDSSSQLSLSLLLVQQPFVHFFLDFRTGKHPPTSKMKDMIYVQHFLPQPTAPLNWDFTIRINWI